jgi:hypothetical protein
VHDRQSVSAACLEPPLNKLNENEFHFHYTQSANCQECQKCQKFKLKCVPEFTAGSNTPFRRSLAIFGDFGN